MQSTPSISDMVVSNLLTTPTTAKQSQLLRIGWPQGLPDPETTRHLSVSCHPHQRLIHSYSTLTHTVSMHSSHSISTPDDYSTDRHSSHHSTSPLPMLASHSTASFTPCVQWEASTPLISHNRRLSHVCRFKVRFASYCIS